MGTISLQLPVSGTIVTAGLHSSNYGTLQTVINGGLDNNNFASGKIFDPTKLMQSAATTGQALVWNGTNWAPGGGSGGQLDRKTITADVTGISATTEGTAVSVITGNSVTYDGSEVKVEYFVPKLIATAGSPIATFVLFYDSTVIGQVPYGAVGGASPAQPGFAFHTPSAAAHTYTLKAFVDSGTVTVKAGAGGAGNLLPAFLRVVKA